MVLDISGGVGGSLNMFILPGFIGLYSLPSSNNRESGDGIGGDPCCKSLLISNSRDSGFDTGSHRGELRDGVGTVPTPQSSTMRDSTLYWWNYEYFSCVLLIVVGLCIPILVITIEIVFHS